MPSLLFKKFRTSEVVELEFDNVEGLLVEEIRNRVSSSMKLPIEELLLVYGGRILKNGKNVTDYYVVAGCTIFVMSNVPKVTPASPATGSQNFRLLENRRILEMIARIIGNPALLQGVMQQGSALERSAAIQQVLVSPQLMANLADPDSILEYIRANPPVAAAMEDFIHQVLGPDAVYEEQSLIELLESLVDEQITMMEEEDEEEEEGEEGEQLALAQEQMFEHSQALQAHHQQQQQQQQQQNDQSWRLPQLNVTVGVAPPPTHQQDSSFNPAASQQHGSLLEPTSEGVAGITRDQLASALAAALESTPVAPIPAQQDYRRTQRTSQASHNSLPPLPPPRQETSSSSVQAGTLHNVSLEPPPPPYSSLFSSTAASRSTSNPGEVSSASGPISAALLQQALEQVMESTPSDQRHQAGHLNHGNPGEVSSASGPISAALLQQALEQVVESTPSDHRHQAGHLRHGPAGTTTRSSERASNQARERRHDQMVDLPALTRRYREQLEQLHLMGIVDDAASLQALAATEGDLMAALEILYSK